MPSTVVSCKHALRRVFQLPLSELFVQIPRLIARLTYLALPLYLSYSPMKTVTIEGRSKEVPLYSHEWPLWTILAAYFVAAIYKVKASDSAENAQQRVFDVSAGGSLKQLQALLLACDDRDSLDSIQVGILSVIVDKTKNLIREGRDGIISANLMVADEQAKVLRLTLFSRHHADRRKIEVPFGAPGAGIAIQDVAPVYVKDIQTPDLARMFRRDAPYRSILSIPIACDHRRIGVVNIDSTEPNAFDMGIVDHLQPYVQMLGLSLCLSGGESAHAERIQA